MQKLNHWLYRRSKTWLLLCVTAIAIARCEAGLKIYYLRHAESGANVAEAWKKVPKEQWPDYVGNSDAFSPKGKQQVVTCTEKLKKLRFDFIAVSPAWRTRNTIAPYLRETHRTGEIWPELLEFASLDHQHDPNQPPPSSNLFSGGGPVKLKGDDGTLFTLREDGKINFRISTNHLQAAADRVAVIERDVGLIRKRFGGSDKTILLVGHGNSGRLLLEKLTGSRKLFDQQLLNTSLWEVEEQPDGTFKALMVNDEPLSDGKQVKLNR